MKFTKKLSLAAMLLCGVMLFAVGCGDNADNNTTDETPGQLDTDASDKDFSSLRTAVAQENAYEYKFNFLPEIDGTVQGYVGDTMPYYENGTYYIYYLKDQGDSLRHSIYLTTTTDFVHYEEKQDAVLVSGSGEAQDVMLGTGSVVKVKNQYYFFYTGHNENRDYHETIMVAEGTSPTSFTKKDGWEILPPSEFGRNDFRDPQAYYDEAKDTITLTITAAQSGVARVIKYTLKGDLSARTYNDIIYTNDETIVGNVWNLECSDTFKFGDKWYLTFSAQDGSVWYVPSSDEQYGPYTAAPKRLDSPLFYAAKHASDGTNTYMVGWARRSESVSSTQDVSGWGGNLQAQEVASDGAGGIKLVPLKAYTQNTKERKLVSSSSLTVNNGDYTEAFRCFERYMVTGKFSYTGTGDFGFAFDYNGRDTSYKTISLSPANQTIALDFNSGKVHINSIPASFTAGQSYAFTYLQEGSVGVLYVEGQAAFTVRIYGVSGRNVRLFSKGSAVSFTELKQYTYTY